MQFDRLGVFTYSPEEGTRAAKMQNQIQEELKDQRKDIIMRLQADISFANNQKRVGEHCTVLVEGFENGLTIARSYAEAPDVDGTILLPMAENIKIGGLYPAEIMSADTYDLYAEWR